MAEGDTRARIAIPQVELVPISALKADGENPNRMEPLLREALAASIKRYGFLAPIVTNKDLLIADGEHRWLIAKELGYAQVPIIRLPVEDVDRRLIRQILNKVRGTHERKADAYEFQKIIDSGRADDVKRLIGMSNATLQRYLLMVNPPKGDTYDFKPIEEYRTDIRIGDIYRLGNHLLLCGDSTKPETYAKLMGTDKAVEMVTDPPYNVDYSSKNEMLDNIGEKRATITTPITNDKMTEKEYDSFLSAFLSAAKVALAPVNSCYIFHASSTERQLLNALKEQEYRLGQILIWKKNRIVMGRTDYHYMHEPIAYCWFGKHQFYGNAERTVWDADSPMHAILHPTMKPVQLCQRAILNSSLPGEIVLDPFSGSGSTLIACEQVERSCRAIEIDPRYCQIIIDRWEHYTGKKAEKLQGA